MSNSKHSQKLHTDILRELYTEVGVRIVSQSDDVRKVHLVDAFGVSHTYAITHFHTPDWTDAIARIGTEIKQGASIGKTFRAQGYTIQKQSLCTTLVKISKKLQEAFATGDTLATLHQYIFALSNGDGSNIRFATITEVYPPDLVIILTKMHMIKITSKITPCYTEEFEEEITV
jgi:hypothetical protein